MSSTWVNLSLTALLPTCSMRVLSKFKPSPNKPMKTGYASESLLKASCGLAPQTIFLNPVPESINPCIHPSFWGRRVPGTASSKAPPNPRLSDQRQLLYERRSPAPERGSEAQPLPPEKHHADAFAFGGFPIICPKFAQMQGANFLNMVAPSMRTGETSHHSSRQNRTVAGLLDRRLLFSPFHKPMQTSCRRRQPRRSHSA